MELWKSDRHDEYDAFAWDVEPKEYAFRVSFEESLLTLAQRNDAIATIEAAPEMLNLLKDLQKFGLKGRRDNGSWPFDDIAPLLARHAKWLETDVDAAIDD